MPAQIWSVRLTGMPSEEVVTSSSFPEAHADITGELARIPLPHPGGDHDGEGAASWY